MAGDATAYGTEISVGSDTIVRLLQEVEEVEDQRLKCEAQCEETEAEAEKVALQECVESLRERESLLTEALEAVRQALLEEAEREEAVKNTVMPGFVRATVNEFAEKKDEDDYYVPKNAPAVKNNVMGDDVAAMYADLCGGGAAAIPEEEEEDEGPFGTNFFCQTCATRVRRQSRQVHETSLAHTLARKITTRSRRVMLPEGNVGAQLLAKLGWRDDGVSLGLGAAGREGRIQPLPTTLKRDTSGLGHRSYPKRVTHFKPYQEAAVALPQRNAPKQKKQDEHKTMEKTTASQRRARAAKQDAKARTAERRRRQEFNTDIPEAYAALFR